MTLTHQQHSRSYTLFAGIIITLCLALGYATHATAQGADNFTILVLGAVTDEVTGEACAATIDWVTPEGKKRRSNSNSKSGEFNQPLPAGITYNVSVSNYDILRQHVSVTLPPSRDFRKHTVNFKVRKIKQGEVLANSNSFEKGTANLNSAGKKILGDLKDMMNGNKSMQVVITVNDEIIPPPPVIKSKPKKKEKPKKAKKGAPIVAEPVAVPVAPPPVVVPLAQQRKDAISVLISGINNGAERVKFEFGQAQPAGTTEPNMTIKVGVVKDLFE